MAPRVSQRHEALRRHKGSGQSFSDVIKEHFRGKTTGSAFRRAVGEIRIDEDTLDGIDALVRGRGKDPAEAPDL